MKFLNSLFSNVDGFIEVRAIRSGQRPSIHFYASIEEMAEQKEILEEMAQTSDVYFGVCKRHKKSGDKTAVKKVTALWVDVDAKDFDGGKDGALMILRQFSQKPSIIVDSGNGFHCYWLLKDPVTVGSAEDIIKVEQYLKALAKALNGDRKAAELARVLRLPGTFNHKNVSEPVRVSILEQDEARLYELADFEPILTSDPDQLETPCKNPEGWVNELLGNLKEGNRNDAFTRVTGRLHRERWSEDDIFTVLKPHAQRCNFSLDELRTLIQGVCKRYPNNKPCPSSVHIVEEAETDSFRVVSVLDFLNQGEQKIEWVVKNIQPKEAVAILSAPGGYGKSWMLLDLAIDVSQGIPWLGVFPTSTGKVLYIDEESSSSLLYTRLKKLLKAKGLEENDINVDLAIQPGLCLTDKGSVAKLHNLLTVNRPQLVIIDALTRVHEADENSAREIAKIFRTVKLMVKEFKCSFLFADHQKKPGAAQVNSAFLLRGSTDKVNAVDAVFSLSRCEDCLRVQQSKARFTERIPSFLIRIKDVTEDSTEVSYEGEIDGFQRQDRLKSVGDFLESVLNTEDWKSRKELVELARDNDISEKRLDEGLKHYLGKLIDREESKEKGRGGKSHVYRLRRKDGSVSEGETETDSI